MSTDAKRAGFLSTLSLRRATRKKPLQYAHGQFLSTLSLRRATPGAIAIARDIVYFYPRSPCGERPGCQQLCGRPTRDFYPRSPCGERLRTRQKRKKDILFLSTLSLRRATAFSFAFLYSTIISIHALLAESDCISSASSWLRIYFYPRSPCGERQRWVTLRRSCFLFLSTLSLRRATRFHLCRKSSVHDFYPRSPCGERRRVMRRPCGLLSISIHALLAESDAKTGRWGTGHCRFLSTLSLRRATNTRIAQSNTSCPNFYPRSPCGERPCRIL